MDVAAAALWYVVTGLVILPAWLAASRIFSGDSRGQRAMHTVVLLWAYNVLVSCSLGCLGILNAVSLGCGSLLLAWGVWMWTRSRFMDVVSQGDATAPDANASGSLARLQHVGWSLIASAGGALVCLRGLAQFPDNWDTLMYHRPLIVHWLQTGSLYVPQGAPWFAPGNNELWGLWWAAPFSGDFWVGLMNVPATVLLALGTFELGRLVGLKGWLGHASVVAVVGGFVVVDQITNAKNDVAAAALFVAGAAYGIRFLESGRRSDLVFSGVALGLLCGIKYYGVGYAAVAWLGISTMMWRTFGARTALAASFLLAATMTLPSSYWYVRNLAASGTPIYPIGFSSSHTPQAQAHESVWRSTLIGGGRVEAWPQYLEAVQKKGSLCQVATLLVLPVSLAWLFGSAALRAKHGGQSGGGAVRAGLGIMILGTFVIFGMTPFTVEVGEGVPRLAYPYRLARFSLISLTLTVICFGMLLGDVCRWLRSGENPATLRSLSAGLLSASFSGLAIWSLGENLHAAAKDDWWTSVLVAVDVVLFLEVLHSLFESREALRGFIGRVACIALVFGGMAVFVVSTVFLSDWWHDGFAVFYDRTFSTKAFSQLEGLQLEAVEAPLPSVAAVCCRYYPFFGSRRQFKAHRPRRVVSESSFFAYLKAREISAVATVHSSPSRSELDWYLPACGWVSNHNGLFIPIASGGTFNLYRVDRGALEAYGKLHHLNDTDQLR